jgi:hypothetical protein
MAASGRPWDEGEELSGEPRPTLLMLRCEPQASLEARTLKPRVMARLGPAIHSLPGRDVDGSALGAFFVDGRVEPGHDADSTLLMLRCSPQGSLEARTLKPRVMAGLGPAIHVCPGP